MMKNELEKVVMENHDLLFGEYSIYLSQKEIRTSGGSGTIPDAFVLDLKDKVWYIVEIELAKHGVWDHIIPQTTKQIVAIGNPETRRRLVDLFMEEIKKSDKLKEKFKKLGISEMEFRKTIEEIIEKPPILAIPIDHISADLKDWVSVIENEVRLYEIKKYVEDETGEIAYRIPEYLFVPSFEIEKDKEEIKITREEFIGKCEKLVQILFEELEKIASEKSGYITLVPRQTAYSFRVRTSRGESALLTIYTDLICILKENLTPEKGFKPEAIEAFAEKIKKIEPLSNKYDIAKIPCFKATPTNISRDDINTFIEAIRGLIDNLMSP